MSLCRATLAAILTLICCGHWLQDCDIIFTVTNLEEDPKSAEGEANADR